MGLGAGAGAQIVLTENPAVLDNEDVIDPGPGAEAAGVVVVGDEEGTDLDIVNSGIIRGRGNAGAGSEAAGDGIRFERERVDGSLMNPSTASFTGTVTNTGTITSEGANGTVAGVRFVNGVSFNGTFNNSGAIRGTQNGVYFGNPVNGVGGDHTGGVFNNLTGGVITSDSRAFNIDGFGLTVNNAGDIVGTGNQRNGTVYVDGTADDYTFNNLLGGLIDAGAGNTGSGFGVEIGGAVDGANTFTLVNDGVIRGRGNADAATNAAGDGVRIGNVGNTGIAEVSAVNNGTITSEGANGTVAGVRFVNGVSFSGTFDNAGAIRGTQNGVYFGNPVDGVGADHSNGVFNNLAGGVITSDSRAFNIDGFGLTVNNAGNIVGTGNQRNGTVYVDGTADDYTFNNVAGGLIDAGAGNTGSGFGVEIGGAVDGANTFSLSNTGIIRGRGDAAAGTNAAGDGVRIGNVGNTGIAEVSAVNNGTITSEGANGTVAGVRFVNGVSFSGTFDNAGAIRGTQNGVYFGNPVDGVGADHSNGVFNNLAGGVITSDSRAFNIDGFGLTVNNAGNIVGTGNQRNGTVYVDGTADDYTFNNVAGGLIDAGAGNTGSGFGVEIGGAVDGANTFSLSNTGIIRGRGDAAAGTNAAGDGVRIGNVGNTGVAEVAIVNDGLITSEGANGSVAGVRFVNGVSFSGTFDNAGIIRGTQNGVYFGNPVDGVGADHSNGVFNNLAGGLITSDSRAFNIDGDGLTLNNAGVIAGTGDQRNGTIYSDATSDNYTINNLETGVIDARVGGNGSGVSLQSGDVDGDSVSFTLNNAGRISGRGSELTPAGVRVFEGAADVVVNGEITNSGVIDSETSAAILIQNVDYQGTINNSGTLSGAASVDASTALGAVTFSQESGTLQGDFIGSAFTDTITLSGLGNTIDGSILGGVDTSIAAGASARFIGDRDLEGNLTTAGAVALDSLAVDGDVTVSGGSLAFDFFGDALGEFDLLSLTGDLSGDAPFTLELDFSDEFSFDEDTRIDFVTVGGDNTLDFALANVIISGAFDNVFVGIDNLSGNIFAQISALAAPEIPLPAAAPLFLSALVGGRLLQRRRKKA